jgi:hypothetical protein
LPAQFPNSRHTIDQASRCEEERYSRAVRGIEMLIGVHPTETMLRGDGKGYNPRDLTVTALAGGFELLTARVRTPIFWGD